MLCCHAGSYCVPGMSFGELFLPLARNSRHPKTPRESVLAAYDCRLAHPIASQTNLAASPNVTVCSFRWGPVTVSKWSELKWKRPGGGCFSSHSVHRKSCDQFRPMPHITSKPRCGPLLRTWCSSSSPSHLLEALLYASGCARTWATKAWTGRVITQSIQRRCVQRAHSRQTCARLCAVRFQRYRLY